MKVTYITSSCFLIEYSDGYKILCDPWLTDGIYYGTWYHNPPLEKDWIKYFNENPPDAIYVSHIHWDHLDPDTLKQFTFKRSPVITGPFETNLYPLKKIVNDCGFNITSEPEGDRFKTWKVEGLELDSFALFTDPAGVNVVNMNDCVYPDVEGQLDVLPIGDIDLAAIPFSGASSYPQCFTNLSDEQKLDAKTKVIDLYLTYYRKYEVKLKNKLTLPVAGSYRLSDPDLNHYLAVPENFAQKEGTVYYPGLRKLLDKAVKRFRSFYSKSPRFSLVAGNNVYKIGKGNSLLNIYLSEELLWELLTRRKHWNNAELGGLLRFSRTGEYDRELHYALSFLHI